jgi:hypothetical protein
MNANPYKSETGCCPRFNPEPWEHKEFRWDNKLFIKDRVRCFFFIPLNFGRVIYKNLALMEKAGAVTPEPPLVLSDHTSKWNMDIYIEVPKEMPGANMARLSGSYMTKVFEGPFKDTKQWCDQMTEWVQSKGKTIKREFMHYTTCPKCAKHYGKNYVVIFAQV